jgi:flagellar motor switch protein FliN/FliY
MSDTIPPDKAELILDIPIGLSVELGRTQLPVRDVLNMAPGTVITLDKQANEPVDLYVNGRLVARGEVVVVDDALGIKITEVVSK